MQKKEFEERTGKTFTDEEYKAIETIYMSVNHDKDEFCKDWLKIYKNELFQQMAARLDKLDDIIAKWNYEYKTLAEENKKLKNTLDFHEHEENCIKHHMKDEDFRRALFIIAGSHSCSVKFNVPVNDNYGNTYDILITESNAAVINKLNAEGYCLSMTSNGLSVNKY